jgi:hypothetical protein
VNVAVEKTTGVAIEIAVSGAWAISEAPAMAQRLTTVTSARMAARASPSNRYLNERRAPSVSFPPSPLPSHRYPSETRLSVRAVQFSA